MKIKTRLWSGCLGAVFKKLLIHFLVHERSKWIKSYTKRLSKDYPLLKKCVRLTESCILCWFVFAQLQKERLGVLHAPVGDVQSFSDGEEQEAGGHLTPDKQHLVRSLNFFCIWRFKYHNTDTWPHTLMTHHDMPFNKLTSMSNQGFEYQPHSTPQ